MTLTSGTRLGPYEVTAAIGAGGMGEVYRAKDTKLGRDVAIKVLPAAFARDPERLRRFEREARVLASLNHTNIAHIYGFESASLPDGSDAHVLVMELVEGEDLAERLSRGPIPTEEAIAIARQIAEGLEEAHERGIVHRDLKPANVRLSLDGKVKVLDFGLAKAYTSETSAAAPPEISRSPTISGQWTEAGAILGTAAYMSPEQARGRPVDKRTDIWAFGVVLYEMLTGRYAFRREGKTDTFAALLRDEVDWGALPPDTPAVIRRLLRRCLERDPGKRLRDAGDARLDLEEALSGSPSEPAAVRATPAERVPTRWPAVAAAAAATAVLAAGGTWLALRPGGSPRQPSRFAIDVPADLRVNDLAVSPDGRRLAFSGTRGGKRQLYLRMLERLEAQPIAGSEGGFHPFFSPDGEWIGYETGSAETGDAELRKVSRSGGPSVSICRGSFRGASWRPDGTILLGSTRGLLAVPAGGGTPRELIPAGEGESHFAPYAIPGTESVLFEVWTGTTPEARIDVVDLRSGERRRVIDGTGPVLSGTGHLLFGRLDSLWGVRFDASRRLAIGEPVRLIEGVANTFRGEGAYGVSDGGDLFYRTPDTVAGRRNTAAWVDRAGNEEPVPLPEHNVIYPRLSPDGTRIAYGAEGLENEDVWLFDLARSIPIRFTVHPAQDLDLTWTASGRQIVFHSHRDGPGNLYRQAANGTGAIERLTTANAEQMPNAASPDGRWLLVTVETSNAGADLHLLALDRPGETVPLVATPANEASAEFSPDGGYIAYASDESGRTEVYVRPFPDVDSDRWQVSSGGGQSPLFSRDGRELFFAVAGSLKRVVIETAPVFRAGAVETVLAGPFVQGRTDERQYDASSDGRRFLMLKEAAPTDQGGDSARLLVVLGWGGELRRLASSSP